MLLLVCSFYALVFEPLVDVIHCIVNVFCGIIFKISPSDPKHEISEKFPFLGHPKYVHFRLCASV